jgi:hypothetical protein
VVCGYKFAL